MALENVSQRMEAMFPEAARVTLAGGRRLSGALVFPLPKEAVMKSCSSTTRRPARERLRRLIEELDGDYEVVGEAATARTRCRRIETDADLVLLDVQMPGHATAWRPPARWPRWNRRRRWCW
jgi:hypothetical protein